MSSDSFKVRKSLVIKPVASPTLDEQGELAYDSVTDKLKVRGSGSTDSVVEETKTQTLTNKTLTSPNVNEAVALTTTATKLNYLTSATGTTGTASSNIMFSASPTTTGTLGAAAATFSGLITSSVNGTGISLTPASGVSTAILDLTNTGGRSRIGIEGSAAGGILGSSSAYDLSIVSATGRGLGLGVDDGAVTGLRIATSTGKVTIPNTLDVTGVATLASSNLFGSTTTLSQTIVGNPTRGRQILLGNTGNNISSIGTRYSSGAIQIAFNASQTTENTDQWAQSTSSTASHKWSVTDNGVTLHTAAASTSTANNATFWGSTVFGVDPTGLVSTIGDISITTAGKGLKVKEGSNARMGTAVLVGGTVTVSNTTIQATTRIFLTSQNDGGTPGFLRVTSKNGGTDFTITSSSGTDTSTVAWFLVEAT